MKAFLRISTFPKLIPGIFTGMMALLLVLGLHNCAFFKSKEKPGVQEERGRTVVSLDCGKCHGEQVQGDGPHHSKLRPAPANLTLVRNSKSMIVSIIHNGVPGTAMPPIPAPVSVIDSVLRYVIDQPKDTSQEWEVPWGIDRDIGPDVELGRSLYVTSCSGCHGENADGNGLWGKDSRIKPKPANFQARNSVMGRLFSIITNGREGTMMPPVKDLMPEKARWALAGYVASIFIPTSTAEIRTPEKGPDELKNPYGKSSGKEDDPGRQAYDLYCAPCHGDQGKGSFQAPRLIDRTWKYGDGTDTDMFVIIEKGIPGRLMPANEEIDEQQRWQLISYLRHRGGLPYPSEE